MRAVTRLTFALFTTATLGVASTATLGVVTTATLATSALLAPARAAEIHQVTSDGGIAGWLIRDESVPVFSISFAFRGGAAAVAPDKAGLAEVSAAMLLEGAGERNSEAFARALDNASISLSFDAGRETFSGSLYALSEMREEAVDLARLTMLAPRLEEDDFARLKDQAIVAATRSADNPGAQAYRLWQTLAFGDHPYAVDLSGQPETLAGLTTDDVRGFLGRVLTRQGLVVGAAGDLTPEEFADMLDVLFGELPDTPPPEQPTPVAAPVARGIAVLERDVPQSVVTFGHWGIARNDPDWYPGQVLNQILGGGGFTSRLMAEVRERRGLVYGIGTGIIPLDGAPVLLGRAATANERVAETIAVIDAEWARLSADGPTQTEVDDAISALAGSFPISLDSTGRLAGVLVAMQRDDLGADYLDKRRQLYEAVTLDEVKELAGRLLRPEAMLTVVVGKPERVEATLPLPAGF